MCVCVRGEGTCANQSVPSLVLVSSSSPLKQDPPTVVRNAGAQKMLPGMFGVVLLTEETPSCRSSSLTARHVVFHGPGAMPAGLISPLAQAVASAHDGAGPFPGLTPAGTPAGSASLSICTRPCLAANRLGHAGGRAQPAVSPARTEPRGASSDTARGWSATSSSRASVAPHAANAAVSMPPTLTREFVSVRAAATSKKT